MTWKFLEMDFPMLAAGALAAIACAMIGCFLVLRRMSLMGDAISHAVLPGIIAAFLLTDSLHALPVFIGAAVVGVLTALLTEVIHRLGRVEPGASMGVVFTVLFAVGVIMLEQVGGRSVHLDPDCVLYGAIEGVSWPDAPRSMQELFSMAPWREFPRQVSTLALVALADAAFVVLFFKELRITSFDPELAAAQGIRPGLMHYLLMTFVAITTIASFEAVGSILVVAMLIVPALVAHLLTDRLGLMIVLSALAALAASAGGYAAAASFSLNAAGTIGLALGALLVIVGLISPQHGWISRLVRRTSLSLSIVRDDLLAMLYRRGEVAAAPATAAVQMPAGLLGRVALWRLRRGGEVELDSAGNLRLTPRGRQRAADLVRSHRLWEAYLVEQAGLRPDHVHSTAEELEHVTDPALQAELARTEPGTLDPHGKEIPSPGAGLGPGAGAGAAPR